MGLLTTRNYFLTLSALATFLLWGISLWNGTVIALIKASWYGIFEDGTPFLTQYTGLFILDFPISLLVAFFFFGTNGRDESYQLFLLDAYSTLQVAFIWLYVESGRIGDKPYSIANPIIWGAIWQMFGAAISLPLYFSFHLKWLNDKPTKLSPVPLPMAKSIPISFAIGALLPAVIGMLPTWIDRSPETHQFILALWQPDPAWVSAIQTIGVLYFGVWRPSRAKNNLEQGISWIRFSYILGTAVSATGHIYVLYKLATSENPLSTARRLYVPNILTGFPSDLKLVDGPWLFLQFDLIIIALSSLSWAYILVSRLYFGKTLASIFLLAEFLVGFLLLGAGATVSLALLWREDELQRYREKQAEKQNGWATKAT